MGGPRGSSELISFQGSSGLRFSRGRLVPFARAWPSRKPNEASLGTLANTGITMHRESGFPWNQVLMAANAPMLTKAALVEGRVDAGILPTGQVVGVIESIPTVADLIEHLIEQATMSLERINSMVDR